MRRSLTPLSLFCLLASFAAPVPGWAQPAPWKCDTLNIAPGERWDVLVKANNLGTWAFHCHILQHAENNHGMFGMVTALVVQAA